MDISQKSRLFYGYLFTFMAALWLVQLLLDTGQLVLNIIGLSLCVVLASGMFVGHYREKKNKKQARQFGFMKIDHIALFCKDLERMRQFFIEHFDAHGNEPYINPRTGLHTYILTFPDGGARLELMFRPDTIAADP